MVNEFQVVCCPVSDELLVIFGCLPLLLGPWSGQVTISITSAGAIQNVLADCNGQKRLESKQRLERKVGGQKGCRALNCFVVLRGSCSVIATHVILHLYHHNYTFTVPIQQTFNSVKGGM